MGGEFIGGFDDIDALHKNSKLSELLKKHGIEHDETGIKTAGTRMDPKGADKP